jgi:hypothetical protein
MLIGLYAKNVNWDILRIIGLMTIAVSIVFGSLVLAQERKSTGQKAGGITSVVRLGALYSVEFREMCRPPRLQSTLGAKVLVALKTAGLAVKFGGNTPLVSQDNLEYSLVATQGDTDLRTGRIFAEVGPGSELSFKNTEGKAVVLQIDVTKVCWNVDFDAIIEKVREIGADHAFITRFDVQDLTSEVNPTGSIGKQRSFRVEVQFYVVNVVSGLIVDVFSSEKRTMDVSSEGAVSSAAEYLAAKIVDNLEKSRKDGVVGW